MAARGLPNGCARESKMGRKVDYACLGRFMDDLLSAGSLHERFQVYEKYIQDLGFDGFTYTYIPNIQLEARFPVSPVFAFSHTYPVAFLEHYAEARFDQQDFTIRRGVMEKCMDVMDWREHERNGLISAPEREVVVVAREDYQLRNGLTVPTMNNQLGIAGASVVSLEKDELFRRLKQEHVGTLLRITQCFHAHTFVDQQLNKRFLEPILRHLNQKEVEILRHLASGKAFKNIEYSVDVASYKVAANILDKLRVKFGGITRDRLMFLVGLLNLLEQE